MHSFCSMFPRSTHETFAQKLYQTFKNHKRFSKPKLSRSDFTICHYAGDVSWNICTSVSAYIITRMLDVICVNSRSLIKLNCSWTRTKITLLQNTRHFFMHQNAPLCLGCFPLHLRNRPNNRSFLQ